MENATSILLVIFPGQGHINPSLQFSKRLVRMGIKVNLLTANSVLNRMSKTIPPPEGLTFTGFFDGYDNGWKLTNNVDEMMEELKSRGSQAVERILKSGIERGQPFSRVLYTTLLPWVGQVAHALKVPSTFLMIQPATILDIYYYYFNGDGDGDGDAFRNNMNDPSWFIDLPGLPRLASRDLPSFLVASNSDNFGLRFMKDQLEILELENNPKVLVNTFDELESEALMAVKKLNLVPIGPLLPSAFWDEKDQSDTSFGGDLCERSNDYIEWLNTKENGSVVYVSFGSYSELPKKQLEEIAKGLAESKRPFLWVIRGSESIDGKGEELEKQGKVVGWCSQVEVLSHPALGCFVTHCGWNSCLETLVCGVPVVCFPLWIDQFTNAKLMEDVWETGIRVRKDEEGIVEGSEFNRCVEIVMGGGEKREEMKRNAMKWKGLAREAAKEGGSSDLNFKNFVKEIRSV